MVLGAKRLYVSFHSAHIQLWWFHLWTSAGDMTHCCAGNRLCMWWRGRGKAQFLGGAVLHITFSHYSSVDVQIVVCLLGSPWSMRRRQCPPVCSPACCKCTQGNTCKTVPLCTSLTILCLGKKNINLPSLKERALIKHLQPTWAIQLEWSTPHPFTNPFSPSCHQPPSDCLCCLPKWGTSHVPLTPGWWQVRLVFV